MPACEGACVCGLCYVCVRAYTCMCVRVCVSVCGGGGRLYQEGKVCVRACVCVGGVNGTQGDPKTFTSTCVRDFYRWSGLRAVCICFSPVVTKVQVQSVCCEDPVQCNMAKGFRCCFRLFCTASTCTQTTMKVETFLIMLSYR